MRQRYRRPPPHLSRWCAKHRKNDLQQPSVQDGFIGSGTGLCLRFPRPSITTPMTTSHKRFFPGRTPRDSSSRVSLDEIIRCAPRPLRSAAATLRRCSVTFSAVPAAKAAAKPRSPRPVRVPRALVGVLAARGTTFRARSARFVPRHGRSRAFSRDAATRPSCRPDTALTPSSPVPPNASGKCPWSDCSCGVGCKCGAACKCGSKRR